MRVIVLIDPFDVWRIMIPADYTVDILHAFLPKKRDEGWNNVYFVMEMLDMSLSGEVKAKSIFHCCPFSNSQQPDCIA